MLFSDVRVSQSRRQTMNDDITVFVGLDVHKDSIAIAAAEVGRAEPRFVGTCGAELRELLKGLCGLGAPGHTLIAYEAGPSGFALARQLATHGWHCQVIAVSKTPRKPGERIKTDRRDALALTRYLRSGDLTSVAIPEAADEAIRDLSRAREDAVRARLKARQQLKAMLLRHGKPFPGKTSWGAAHERYLARVAFDHAAQQIAFAEYRSAILESHERVERLTTALREQVERWRFGPVVRALMCFKGIDFVAATIIVSELGDLRRFEHPRQLMAYLGLVPSEYSSGTSRRQGSITKTGNSHVRRILVESAWCYRYSARLSRPVVERQLTQPKAVRDIAWRAQLRLCSRYRRLCGRGMHSNKICVAVARELAGFVWEAARHVQASIR
jgi:transposase